MWNKQYFVASELYEKNYEKVAKIRYYEKRYNFETIRGFFSEIWYDSSKTIK